MSAVLSPGIPRSDIEGLALSHDLALGAQFYDCGFTRWVICVWLVAHIRISDWILIHALMLLLSCLRISQVATH